MASHCEVVEQFAQTPETQTLPAAASLHVTLLEHEEADWHCVPLPLGAQTCALGQGFVDEQGSHSSLVGEQMSGGMQSSVVLQPGAHSEEMQICPRGHWTSSLHGEFPPGDTHRSFVQA